MATCHVVDTVSNYVQNVLLWVVFRSITTVSFQKTVRWSRWKVRTYQPTVWTCSVDFRWKNSPFLLALKAMLIELITIGVHQPVSKCNSSQGFKLFCVRRLAKVRHCRFKYTRDYLYLYYIIYREGLLACWSIRLLTEDIFWNIASIFMYLFEPLGSQKAKCTKNRTPCSWMHFVFRSKFSLVSSHRAGNPAQEAQQKQRTVPEADIPGVSAERYAPLDAKHFFCNVGKEEGK